jgi:hypothetical protein
MTRRAQFAFFEFADGGARNFVRKNNFIGQLPLGEARGQEFAQLVPRPAKVLTYFENVP